MKTENLKIPAFYKLEAIAYKQYQYQEWDIKIGDYFTICRNDEELFKVVDINKTHFKYVLCNGSEQKPDTWDLQLSDFGEHFIHVPEFIMNEIFKINERDKKYGIINLKYPELMKNKEI